MRTTGVSLVLALLASTVAGRPAPADAPPAGKALDAYFLEARARLLDLAAILDRIGRGADARQTGGFRYAE